MSYVNSRTIANSQTGVLGVLLSSPLAVLLNLLATVHVVWFYLSWVHPYLQAPLFEQGLERTPYQHRMLMMWPMRWAHNSSMLNALANRLDRLSDWFEPGVRPEGVVQAVIYVLSVAVAGLVACALYNACSRTRILSPFIYPFTLVMITVTYCLGTMHHIRMPYDLPSVGFFSLGLALIYFRLSNLLFFALFVVGTINRETTFFLLLFLALRTYDDPNGRSLRRLLDPKFLFLVASLSAFWLGWHHWVSATFAHNTTESLTRWKRNIVLLINPLTWPQFFSVGAFTVPLLLANRQKISDNYLRLCLWCVACWLGFMILFGHVVETRVFGELIPYFVCCAALIAEHVIVSRFAETSLPWAKKTFDLKIAAAARPATLENIGDRL